MQATNISFQVNGRYILKGVSFDALPGKLLVILGSNGAGKSTLLKILSGELIASSGNVILDGIDLNKHATAELAKFRGVLHQQTALNLPFTVYEVVMMGRYPHYANTPQQADHTTVNNVLAQTGITHLAHRNYLTLSGGEQQRVHLARVFAQVHYTAKHPIRYLFMDEPVNSLDILHQHTTLQLAKEFAREGNCVIAVLHDLNLGMQYADNILMLKNGIMVCCGNTQQVLNSEVLSTVYDFPLKVLTHSLYNYPVIIPAFAN